MARQSLPASARHVDLHSDTSRKTFASMLDIIFTDWALSADEKARLVSDDAEEGREIIERCEAGDAIPDDSELLRRVGDIIAIWNRLRSHFAGSPKKARDWVHQRNSAFNGRAPLRFMLDEGVVALRCVRSHLIALQRGI